MHSLRNRVRGRPALQGLPGVPRARAPDEPPRRGRRRPDPPDVRPEQACGSPVEHVAVLGVPAGGSRGCRLARRRPDAADSPAAPRQAARSVEALRQERDDEPDVVVQGSPRLVRRLVRPQPRGDRHHGLIIRQRGRCDGGLRRTRRHAVRDVHHAAVPAGDEGADGGLRVEARGRPDDLRPLAARRGLRRPVWLVPGDRLRVPARREQHLRDRGLQDDRATSSSTSSAASPTRS